MLESDFGKQIVTAIEGSGGVAFKVHGHAMQKSGWPDLQVYGKKWTGHIELKVNDETSNIQKLVICDLLARGTPALVLRWVSGCVQAEDERGTALGYITAEQWSRVHNRSEVLMSLLNMATIVLRDSKRLSVWVQPWQLNELGGLAGQVVVVR